MVALVGLLAGVAYALAAGRLRRRGDGWPGRRDGAFGAGVALLLWGWCGPLPGGPFTEHSVRHLFVGMAAPVLLVMARPLTLTLRTLPPGGPRRGLLSVAHSRIAGWLLLPPLAAALHIGGVWALYRTGLMSVTHRHPPLDVLVHLHMVGAGLLFGFAVCQLDPVRRRRSLPVRAGTLLVAGAAHAALAKGLYAAGPPGTAFTADDLHTGAQIMYYGGDAAELLLAAALAVQWYAATGRRQTRAVTRRGYGTGLRVQRPQA
ncbi:cytochrome c oxidase assembly protein [Streptomyces sp.]|uniref:cytochrome c oxidase assembly protein n=1 Tax=Streptomyces sp. TaxID=1931 RepID=UPI002D6B0A1E|nr:cytochrome c oxidase assembly protein [Streptomyces sp.]HZF88390.1 cytochrome c oxidase assembly protein [Streptomyces sp.]